MVAIDFHSMEKKNTMEVKTLKQPKKLCIINQTIDSSHWIP